MDKYYAAALHTVSGMGPSRIQKLMDYFGSAQQAWTATRGDLFLSKCLDTTTCNNFIKQRENINVPKMVEDWQKSNIHICTLGDEDYPILLRHIYNPPYILYYRGILPRHDCLIAMVGARKATAYGKNAAFHLASQLAKSGFSIVSGAARGIDTASHLGALSEGQTVAVLGCGVDVVYPPENRKLFEQIANQGVLISEYLPGTRPHPGYFPARNRIISGCSRGVIVVEAAEKSGSLMTADFALDEGRDVYAVPGSIFSPSSEGTHRLIQQGGKLVTKLTDIVHDNRAYRQPSAAPIQLGIEESIIYNMLDHEMPVSVEEIAEKTNFSIPTVSFQLIQMEIRGLVAANSSHCYVRTAKEVIR